MSVAELGVMIPIIGVMIPIVAITTKHKRQMAELEVRKLEASKGQGNDRTEWLEDRVKVLEAIVTDKGYDLAHQIEALRGDSGRDKPPLETRPALDNRSTR